MSEWLKERGLNRTAHNALEWANSKITSGELMVVKTVTDDIRAHIYTCAGMHIMGSTIEKVRFCPGCGAKIIA